VKEHGNSLERQQHRSDLEKHLREFRAYREALDRFHRLYGPVGN
jgi:hypothetical protein